MKKKIVTFESMEENFIKEKCNLKPNTVRKCEDSDKRFGILTDWMLHENFELQIKIICTENKRSFQRLVKDVTFWDGYCVISWCERVNE